MFWFVLMIICGEVSGIRGKFEAEPQSLTAIEGYPVVFTCRILPAYRDYPVYWKINDNVVSSSSRAPPQRLTWTQDKVRGIHDLKINKAAKGDEGQYVCLLHIPGSEIQLEESRTALLTVIQIPHPKFVEEPPNRTATEGETVDLNCHIGDFTEDSLNVIWIKEGSGELSENLFISKSLPGVSDIQRYSIQRKGKGEFRLQIANVTLEDAGDFRCTVSLKNGTGYVLESRFATLSVVHSDCYIESQSDTGVYVQGENITAACNAEVYPADDDRPLLLSWSRSGQEFRGSNANKRQGGADIRDTWSLSRNDDNESLLCQIRLANSSRKTICEIGPIQMKGGSSNTLLAVGYSVTVILVVGVLTVGGVFLFRFYRQRRRKKRKAEMKLRQFYNALDINVTLCAQSDSQERRNVEVSDKGSHYAELELRNEPVIYASADVAKSQERPVEDVAGSVGGPVEVTYAKVNKSKKKKKPAAAGDVEPTITNENEVEPVPPRMEPEPDDIDSDDALSSKQPNRATEGLVYAELDIATDPNSNQQPFKSSEPRTVYAELQHQSLQSDTDP